MPSTRSSTTRPRANGCVRQLRPLVGLAAGDELRRRPPQRGVRRLAPLLRGDRGRKPARPGLRGPPVGRRRRPRLHRPPDGVVERPAAVDRRDRASRAARAAAGLGRRKAECGDHPAWRALRERHGPAARRIARAGRAAGRDAGDAARARRREPALRAGVRPDALRPRPASPGRRHAHARGKRRSAAAGVDPGHHRGAAGCAVPRGEGAHPGRLGAREGRLDRARSKRSRSGRVRPSRSASTRSGARTSSATSAVRRWPARRSSPSSTC